ncbi:MAG TPA: trehalase-like domain-containing protein, partial [Chloroflexota bacterium]|nr:trehalase-like domain-containing protein [Chloroflexota bacterium]
MTTGLSIADYALLSDCRSAALISREGSIDWLCVPRFDSGSVFGRLLDAAAGHWSIRPVDHAEVSRRYLPETMVLETTFRCPSGTLRLVDGMALGEGARRHDLGLGSPGVLLRQATCVEGEVALQVEFAPRPEYGIVYPLLAPTDGGLVARGGSDVLVLSAPMRIEVDRSTARINHTLRAGESVGFALQHARSSEPVPAAWSPEQIAERLEDTLAGWQSWSAIHQQYDGPWRELVHHSGRVLQALTFRPTGAIVAAPTTSLPESVGGERNWDYRYTWVRDASLTLQALWVAACPDEAELFFSWMANAVAGQLGEGRDLQI